MCAICDGATVSYDPAPWAELLCQKFLLNNHIDRDWLSEAIASYEKNYDRDALPWMQQAAFDRGSFSTLLGVTASTDGRKAYIFGIGDSVAIIADGLEFVSSFPYTTADQFDAAPILLSTSRTHNRLVTPELLEAAIQPVQVAELSEPVLLLMTDALGRWCLERRDGKSLATLLSLTTDELFADFVETERVEGRLRRDDTTLVVMARVNELSEQHRSE